MAFDGVFAFQGKNHITASQLGRLVQGTAGDGRYVLPTQDRLQATMQTANKVVIGSGDLVMDGRYVTNESGVELTVESGTSGYNRNDIVALRYSKDGSTGVESFEPEVIKGTPVTGTAADPAVDAGAISDGSSEALMPLWRIPIRGLAPGTPERIATVGKTLSEIGDSVSRLTSPCVFSTASTSYVPFPVDLSSATFVVLTTSVNGNARGLASTVMTASSFVSECLSGDKSMQVVYASEQDNYTAYAYYSSGKVYLKSRSQYDSAVFIVL